jgi:GAF domain-containing protein/HAMP domain-containing protein
MAHQPDIASMDPVRQASALQALTRSHHEMYLASTTGMDGVNIARSDGGALQNYSDREWFQKAAGGAPIAFQTVVGRTTGLPALVGAVPIRNEGGQIVGVVMFASDLSFLTREIQATQVGDTGLAYLVDNRNQAVAHPEIAGKSELVDMGKNLAVAALRQGERGLVAYTEADGSLWRAYIRAMPNGWGVIVQQPETELLSAKIFLQRMTWILLVTGSLSILGLVWLVVRQSVKPVRSLTETARAIARGDLERTAPIESDDELGVLASTFNQMTSQLRELISGLEARVTERTRDLERQADHLKVTAEVAREAATIHETEELLKNTVRLVAQLFGYAHTGIFLLDGKREYAVLRAASSEGGQRMLARRHQLKAGQEGIVGYVAARGEPRIAHDVGDDAVFFNNPDLPLTRSEAALPLMVHGSVIGVLDVQSNQPAAFKPEDLEILQTLADQVAVAIENSRLFAESARSLEEVRSLYGQQVRDAWQKRLANRSLAFAYDLLGVRPTSPDGHVEADSHTLKQKIQLRGQTLGTLVLRRDSNASPWTETERELVREASAQVALALENARLIEEVQHRALREQQINQITTQVRSSSNLETILQNTVRELGKALGASRTYVRLGSQPSQRSEPR